MLLELGGPFARFDLASVATHVTKACHYCTTPHPASDGPEDDHVQDRNSLVCAVCGRTNAPPWLTTHHLHVGARFLLRGEVMNVVGVVIEIDLLKKVVGTFSVTKTTKSSRHAIFTKMDVSEMMVAKLELLPPESSWHAVLDAHGLCSHCKHTYHIANTETDGVPPTAERLMQEVAMLEQLKCDKEKAHGHATSREMVQRTLDIKAQDKVVWQLKKRLEQVQMWCPHCGRNPAILSPNNV
ncbi:Aste57867_7960 [Aphanomyces stellatus]|uniref:Aste57867_7960 protein n=1 Tax=Aphanomyces stellatus TaxID=120398 RepID=A0A485KJ29_9STRA|nr:hypothetical protein As57867_007930 [Aphanomyces stellatus]VFT84853.1 Aste57867_7960 [Aphanomyces stellatus]